MIVQLVHRVIVFVQSIFNLLGLSEYIFIRQFRFFSLSAPYTFTNTVFYPTRLDHSQITQKDDSFPYQYLNCVYYYEGKKYQSIYRKKLIWDKISFRNLVKPKLFQLPIPLIVKAELLNEDKTQSKDVTELVSQYMGPFNDYYYNSKTIVQPTMLAIISANKLNKDIWYHMKIEDSFLNEHMISRDSSNYNMPFYKILTQE